MRLFHFVDFIFQKSTVIHEFGHAIGMNHEQSRSDRDNHLKVLFENIRDDKESNLHKRTTLDNNPYDYYSLMQYGLSVSTYMYVVIQIKKVLQNVVVSYKL